MILTFSICVLSQVLVNIVHAGVGPVSQSDVDNAQACGACIVGFNVRDLPSSISLAATQAKVKVDAWSHSYFLLKLGHAKCMQIIFRL